MVTMKHTIGLAIILSTLAAACGPTFTSGSVGIGDGAVLDDDTADTGVEDAQAADAGRSDASADSGTVAADAQTPPHDDGQPVDVIVAADAVEQPEADPWPPDGAVLGDPDVQDASADSGPQDTGALADVGQDAGVTADVQGDTPTPPDAAQDAGDAGGAEDVDPWIERERICAQRTSCGSCLADWFCGWCMNQDIVLITPRCESLRGGGLCPRRLPHDLSALCR